MTFIFRSVKLLWFRNLQTYLLPASDSSLDILGSSSRWKIGSVATVWYANSFASIKAVCIDVAFFTYSNLLRESMSVDKINKYP